MHNMEKKMVDGMVMYTVLGSTGKKRIWRKMLEVQLVMSRISFVYKYKQ